MNRFVSTIIATFISVGPVAAQPRAEKPVSVVLVHGAFVDASGWKQVHDLLVADGYQVLVVQNSTVSLESDVAATRRAIAAAQHPVVLVGHSYGGAVITQAGDDPKVRNLVYLAAFAPDVGESVLQLAQTPTPGEVAAPLLPPADGYVIVDPTQFPTAFAGDVDQSTTRFMAASQVPWGLQALSTPLSRVAWKSKPSSFLVTTQDRMIPPSAQRVMARRAKAQLLEVYSSHAVMLSHPNEVVAFIMKSAAP